jgi:hypothetical protein
LYAVEKRIFFVRADKEEKNLLLTDRHYTRLSFAYCDLTNKTKKETNTALCHVYLSERTRKKAIQHILHNVGFQGRNKNLVLSRNPEKINPEK